MVTVTRRKFTLEEYHRLGELGFFNSDERVELIRGEVIKMVAKGTAHSVCNTRLRKALYKLINDRAELRSKNQLFFLLRVNLSLILLLLVKKRMIYLLIPIQKMFY